MAAKPRTCDNLNIADSSSMGNIYIVEMRINDKPNIAYLHEEFCDCGCLKEESVVIRATEVVAALGTDQFAVVADEAMATVGAYLGVVVNGTRIRSGSGAGIGAGIEAWRAGL